MFVEATEHSVLPSWRWFCPWCCSIHPEPSPGSTWVEWQGRDWCCHTAEAEKRLKERRSLKIDLPPNADLPDLHSRPSPPNETAQSPQLLPSTHGHMGHVRGGGGLAVGGRPVSGTRSYLECRPSQRACESVSRLLGMRSPLATAPGNGSWQLIPGSRGRA